MKQDDVVWEDALRGAEGVDAPGQEYTAVSSGDDRFTFDLWQRRL